MGLFLIFLSFLTYPVFVPVSVEQQSLWGAGVVPDIFMYLRAVLIIITALTIAPVVTPFKNWDNWKVTGASFLCAASVIFSKYPQTSLFGTPNYHEGYLVFIAYLVFIVCGKFPEKAVRISVYIVTGLAVLQAVWGCYLASPLLHWAMPKWITFVYQRWPIYSSFGHPNHLGLFCALLLPYFLFKAEPLPSILLFILLICSGSRAGALAVCVVLYSRLVKDPKIFISTMLITMFLFLPRILDTVKQVHIPLRDTDLSGRVFIWKNTLPLLKDKWIKGAGPGAFAMEFAEQNKRLPEFTDRIVDRPHNMYLNIWHSYGFLCLLVLGAIAREFFKKCTHLPTRMGVLGFLVAALFTDSVVSVTPFFALMLGRGIND